MRGRKTGFHVENLKCWLSHGVSSEVQKPNEEHPMITEDIILHIFYLVTTTLPVLTHHSQAKLEPSELLAIGILEHITAAAASAAHNCG